MHHAIRNLFPPTAALLLVAGCQPSEPEAIITPVIQEAVMPVEVVTPQAKVDPRAKLIELMTDYVAPFPGRTDMFEPPKDAPRQASSVSDGTVQLRGLVDLGEPQAILDIEGAIAIVPVGSEKYGVRVVSIDNQKVTLQRGQTEWTASLD